MKRLLLASALSILGTFSCRATPPTWSYVGQNEKVTMYLDTSNITRMGEHVSVWALWNAKTPAGIVSSAVMSSIHLTEIDCAASTSVIRTILNYSGQMGSGNLVDSITVRPDDLMPEVIVPGSFSDDVKDVVCSR